MLLPEFTLHRPHSLGEALGIAATHPGDCDFVAGGTDLLPNYKWGLNPKGHVISLTRVSEMKALSPTCIGGAVSLTQLHQDPEVGKALPLLAEVTGQIASPLLRNAGTVGGNLLLDTRCYYFNQSWFWRDAKNYCLKADGEDCLVVPGKGRCYATYSGDLAPALLVLGATLLLASEAGERRVPLRSFYVDEGIQRSRLLPGEILVAVELPEDAPGLVGGYQKLRIRDAIDFPSLGVAVALRKDERGRLEHLELATTAVASAPLLHSDLTSPLLGQVPQAERWTDLAHRVMERSRCYLNVPLPPRYRQQMVAVLARRLLFRLSGMEAEKE